MLYRAETSFSWNLRIASCSDFFFPASISDGHLFGTSLAKRPVAATAFGLIQASMRVPPQADWISPVGRPAIAALWMRTVSLMDEWYKINR